MSNAWYLIYSKPNQERIARDNLERQGYQVFFPQIRNNHRHARSLVKVISPLFPRYLFVSLNKVLDNWSPIRSTIGVANIVRFGDLPLAVPPTLIDSIKARVGEQCIVNATERQFSKNEKVRILFGSMAGYEAIFCAKSSRERVSLLLDILGRSAEIVLPLSYIE